MDDIEVSTRERTVYTSIDKVIVWVNQYYMKAANRVDKALRQDSRRPDKSGETDDPLLVMGFNRRR